MLDIMEGSKKNPKVLSHLKHRERLREKFRKRGSQSFDDYELLEMFLFRIIPRQDVRVTAREILQSCGSLNRLFYGETQDLLKIKSIGQKTVDEILLLQELFVRSLKERTEKRAVFGAWSDIIDYYNASLGYKNREELRVLYLNGKNELIKDEHMQKGTHDQTPIYPREIMYKALECHADAMILVHNHPSGHTKPSKQDIHVSKEILRLARSLRIRLLDHVIFGRGKFTSMKNEGYLDF